MFGFILLIIVFPCAAVSYCVTVLSVGNVPLCYILWRVVNWGNRICYICYILWQSRSRPSSLSWGWPPDRDRAKFMPLFIVLAQLQHLSWQAVSWFTTFHEVLAVNCHSSFTLPCPYRIYFPEMRVIGCRCFEKSVTLFIACAVTSLTNRISSLKPGLLLPSPCFFSLPCFFGLVLTSAFDYVWKYTLISRLFTCIFCYELFCLINSGPPCSSGCRIDMLALFIV